MARHPSRTQSSASPRTDSPSQAPRATRPDLPDRQKAKSSGRGTFARGILAEDASTDINSLFPRPSRRRAPSSPGLNRTSSRRATRPTLP